MTPFEIKLAERRRLLILQFLYRAGCQASDRELEIGLKAVGARQGLTLQAVRDDIHWLGQKELVAYDVITDGAADPDEEERVYFVAKVTDEGIAVAQGNITVKGVRRAIDEA
jgi:hypothetical protein